MTEQEQQQKCVCCSCRSVFDQYDSVLVERRYGNVLIKEKRCPFCEGVFRKVDVPKMLDKYLFINTDPRYYSN